MSSLYTLRAATMKACRPVCVATPQGLVPTRPRRQQHRPKLRKAEVLLVDLDDCIYNNKHIIDQVPANIHQYMHERLNIPQEKCKEYNTHLYSTYGTSLAGLVASGHSIDYDEWHAFIHGTLPYEQHLQPDLELRALLDSLSQPKFIFSNADRAHVETCLQRLGIAECFQGTICFENTMEAAARWGMEGRGPGGSAIVCKPSHAALEVALRLAGCDPASAVLFDDSHKTVSSAVEAGVFGVLVNPRANEQQRSSVSLHVHSLLDLPLAMPWLWGEEEGAACRAARPLELEGDTAPAAA